jgi:integrase
VSHKAAQARLKMANRTTYRDFRLVFAKEHEHTTTRQAALGQPIKSLDRKPFRAVVATAKVKPIRFHGLRHTTISLLLAAGEPVHAVAQGVGHANPTMTLQVYGHVLRPQQVSQAAKIGAVLYG